MSEFTSARANAIERFEHQIVFVFLDLGWIIQVRQKTRVVLRTHCKEVLITLCNRSAVSKARTLPSLTEEHCNIEYQREHWRTQRMKRWLGLDDTNSMCEN